MTMQTHESNAPRTLRTLGFIALGLAVGVGGTLLLRPAPKAAAPAAAPKKTMYQCPMHLQIMQDHPGACPICGMDLVPMDEVAAGQGTDTHAAVKIDLERQQLIGLRIAKAAVGEVDGGLRASGRVAVDETRVRKVTLKVEGFVEKLFVDFVGKAVAKGQPLLSFYSPEFVSVQREYLLALKTQKALSGGALQGSGGDILEAARQRLGFWDVPKEVIERLEKTGEVQRALTLRSPIDGVVTVKNVVEGARLTPAETPFEITDLSRVWVVVDVFAAELARAKVGTPAEFTVQGLAGKVFKGRVAFVDPVMDPKTRTARLRLEFPNGSGELRPDMFGEVALKVQGRKGLLVPSDAVLDAGASKVVFIALGDGRFAPREVTTGLATGESVEVLTGLEAGEEVVVRANFLVDSESRLKAALAQMSRKDESKATPASSGH